ncbi:hypothetical protein ACQPX6_10015 [Actinomycetospora sp. CA-101289]|uniref:hypothetical protein n=1 Tax=Actinomycetospora sp. CA-101289 TaxID=3239893 RepID=UPI003D95EB72
MRWAAALVLALFVVAGCTVGEAPREDRGGAIEATPERVARALRFAALAPLPAAASVTRLEVQNGIDTRVALAVRLPADAAGPWFAASGLPADGSQQRVANPDGAVVYRSAMRTGPDGVTVTAFTT